MQFSIVHNTTSAIREHCFSCTFSAEPHSVIKDTLLCPKYAFFNTASLLQPLVFKAHYIYKYLRSLRSRKYLCVFNSLTLIEMKSVTSM